jgi:hypothetical protein
MFAFCNCEFELWLAASLAPTAYAVSMSKGGNYQHVNEHQGCCNKE